MKKKNKEEALRWLIHAKDEFGDADELRKRERFYLALFLFQQATEKSLKAFLYLKTGATDVFRTHSVDDLIKMATEMDTDFEQMGHAKKLDRYYILTRYPNGLPGSVPSRYFDDPEEAKQAMKMARDVMDLVEEKFGERIEEESSEGENL